MTTKKILQELASCEPGDLREVKRRVDLLLKGNPHLSEGSTPGDSEDQEYLLYDVIKENLSELGTVVPPFHVFRSRSKHFKTLRANTPIVTEFMVKYLRPRGKAESLKALRLCVDVLVKRIKETTGLTALLPIVNNLSKVPALMDKAFPGYAESNLLSMVLRMPKAS